MPSRPRSFLRAAAFVLAGAALAVGVGAGPAAAADPIAIEVSVGTTCLKGAAPDGTIRTTVKRTGVKDMTTTTPVSGGRFKTCFSRTLLPGDRIRFTDGALTHQLTVPVLDAFMDRTTDTLSGHAGAGVLSIDQELMCLGSTCNGPLIGVTPDPDGSFLVDMTPWGFGGTSWTDLRLTVASGDAFLLRAWSASIRAPGPRLTTVSVRAARTGPVTVTVRNAAGVVRGVGRGTVKADGKLHPLTILKNGVKVRLAGGDRVSASFSKEAKLTLPASLAVTGDATEDIVRGTCYPDSYWSIQVGQLPDVSQWADLADGTGAVATNHFDLQAGQRLTLQCYVPLADEVVLTGTVH